MQRSRMRHVASFRENGKNLDSLGCLPACLPTWPNHVWWQNSGLTNARAWVVGCVRCTIAKGRAKYGREIIFGIVGLEWRSYSGQGRVVLVGLWVFEIVNIFCTRWWSIGKREHVGWGLFVGLHDEGGLHFGEFLLRMNWIVVVLMTILSILLFLFSLCKYSCVDLYCENPSGLRAVGKGNSWSFIVEELFWGWL